MATQDQKDTQAPGTGAAPGDVTQGPVPHAGNSQSLPPADQLSLVQDTMDNTAAPVQGITSNQLASTPSDGTGGLYHAESDITEELPDGRVIQLAAKGSSIPMAQAVQLGLVKDQSASASASASGASKGKGGTEKK